MRAGLATLDILEDERLGERAAAVGGYLCRSLRERLGGYEMVREVRGLGLLLGIEFQAPRQFWRRASFDALDRIHSGVFGQMLVMCLFRQEDILTQVCGNNLRVLKVAPPLVVTEDQMEQFIRAICRVVEQMHSSMAFWTEALGLVSRLANV